MKTDYSDMFEVHRDLRTKMERRIDMVFTVACSIVVLAVVGSIIGLGFYFGMIRI